MDPNAPQEEPKPSLHQDPKPTSPAHPKKFPLIMLITLLIALLTLAASAYTYYTNPELPQLFSSPTPTPTITQPTPIPTDPTANWKTYTNNAEGFSFQYPLDALIKTEQAFGFMTSKTIDELVVSPPYQEPYDKWYKLTVRKEDNTLGSSAKQLVTKYITDYKAQKGDMGNYVADKVEKSMKEYTNNEIDGIFAMYGADSDFAIIVQVKNNKIYTFTMVGDQGIAGENELKLFDQILSTFKFIN